MNMREEVVLSRNADAVMIPSVERVVIPEWVHATITQSLGGSERVVTDRGLMVGVSGRGGEANDVKLKIESLPGVKQAEVEVVFDPVWDRSMMSEAAKLQLGMYW